MYFNLFDSVTAAKQADAITATATKTIRVLKNRLTGKSSSMIWIDDMYPDYINIGVHHKMYKVHYQHFLRLYNRKRFHKVSTLDEHGYQSVKVQGSYKPAHTWCEQNLKPGSFVHLNTRFWFAYDADAVLFKMHWL